MLDLDFLLFVILLSGLELFIIEHTKISLSQGEVVRLSLMSVIRNLLVPFLLIIYFFAEGKDFFVFSNWILLSVHFVVIFLILKSPFKLKLKFATFSYFSTMKDRKKIILSSFAPKSNLLLARYLITYFSLT